VEYYYPQAMLHANTSFARPTDDVKLCDPDAKWPEIGAPTGNRVRRASGECIKFSPPSFKPWSYKVSCMEGDIVPYPDASVVRNEPGHPDHGALISSQCSACSKSNTTSARGAAPAGKSWRVECLNMATEHAGSISDGALNPYTARFKDNMVVGLDRDQKVRKEWDWCCAPGAADDPDVCYEDDTGRGPDIPLDLQIHTPNGNKTCDVKKEPWLGDIQSECGMCGEDKNGLPTWRAMPDPLPFPWGTFYIKNEKCWLQKEDVACFNDRSSFSYYGENICCTDPRKSKEECGYVNVGLGVGIIAVFFAAIIAPTMYFCYRYHKQKEYSPVP